MQSGQKQVVLGKGEKERRERRKEKRKRKKKEKREERKKKKNKEGVSCDSVYFKSFDFPWNLSV